MLEELVENLYIDFYENLWYVTERDRTMNAKQCTLITVNKIMNEHHNWINGDGMERFDLNEIEEVLEHIIKK